MVLATYTVYKLYKEGCPDFYIGSTFDFKKRQREHKTDCNNPNSKRYNYPVYQFIRNNCGYNSWSYEILQQFNNDLKVKDELHYIERAYIELLNPSLNREIPMRTIKEWRQDNKEKIKQHYQDNKEHYKQYYQDNKEAIKQYKKEKFICECGGKYITSNKLRHFKTKKHQNYFNA
jgi:hypothetical protein